jgi:hypothetical protein
MATDNDETGRAEVPPHREGSDCRSDILRIHARLESQERRLIDLEELVLLQHSKTATSVSTESNKEVKRRLAKLDAEDKTLKKKLKMNKAERDYLELTLSPSSDATTLSDQSYDFLSQKPVSGYAPLYTLDDAQPSRGPATSPSPTWENCVSPRSFPGSPTQPTSFDHATASTLPIGSVAGTPDNAVEGSCREYQGEGNVMGAENDSETPRAIFPPATWNDNFSFNPQAAGLPRLEQLLASEDPSEL